MSKHPQGRSGYGQYEATVSDHLAPFDSVPSVTRIGSPPQAQGKVRGEESATTLLNTRHPNL